MRWSHPDSMRVRIRRNAVMDPLTNAVITANFVTKHHRIYNATVDIKAKRNYTARAISITWTRTRRLQDRSTEIKVDTGYADLCPRPHHPGSGFQLSPAFDFFGDVALTASIKELTFTGKHAHPARLPMGLQELDEVQRGHRPLEVFIPVADTLVSMTRGVDRCGCALTDEDPFKVPTAPSSAARGRPQGQAHHQREWAAVLR
jgi:hypothetical protein